MGILKSNGNLKEEMKQLKQEEISLEERKDMPVRSLQKKSQINDCS